MQVFLTPDFLAIAMEYAPGGDMFQYVKKMGGLWVRAASPLHPVSPNTCNVQCGVWPACGVTSIALQDVPNLCKDGQSCA